MENNSSKKRLQKGLETSGLDRRAFLKSSAAIGLTGLAVTVPSLGAMAKGKKETPKPEPSVTASFTFKNGKFKILQITDTHYFLNDKRCDRVKPNVTEMIEKEQPDLIIHSGDIIGNGGKMTNGEESVREVLGWIADYKIPFAVALGNHDGETGISREGIFKIIKTIPYNINKGVEGIYGDSNDVIALASQEGGVPEWVFYLFDTGNKTDINVVEGRDYDFIHHDQIGWYRGWSERFREMNGGKPIPSIAFFHIPLPEFGYAFRDMKRIIKGNMGEDPAVPAINSGLFTNFKEMRDVVAISCGHDHDNDYAMKWKEMFLMYTRFSGGDTVYNNIKPNGARVFEFTEGESGCRSWICEFGGNITQNIKYPEGFIQSH